MFCKHSLTQQKLLLVRFLQTIEIKGLLTRRDYVLNTSLEKLKHVLNFEAFIWLSTFFLLNSHFLEDESRIFIDKFNTLYYSGSGSVLIASL